MRADGLDQEWVAEAAAGPGPAWHRLFQLPVRDAATVSDISVRLARGGGCTVPRSVVQRVAARPGGGEESFWQCVAGGGAGDEQLLSRVSWSPIGSGGEPIHSQTTLATLARTDNAPSFVLKKQPPNSTEEGKEITEISIPNEKQLFRDMKIGYLLGENLNSWDEKENVSEKVNMERNRADRESIRRSLRDLKTSIKDLTELVETKNKPNGAVLPNANGLVKHNSNRVREHNGSVNGNLSPAAAGRERGARPSRGGGRDEPGGTGPRLLLSLKYNRTTSVVSGTFVKNASSRYSFTDFGPASASNPTNPIQQIQQIKLLGWR